MDWQPGWFYDDDDDDTILQTGRTFFTISSDSAYTELCHHPSCMAYPLETVCTVLGLQAISVSN